MIALLGNAEQINTVCDIVSLPHCSDWQQHDDMSSVRCLPAFQLLMVRHALSQLCGSRRLHTFEQSQLARADAYGPGFIAAD